MKCEIRMIGNGGDQVLKYSLGIYIFNDLMFDTNKNNNINSESGRMWK
jgi:hypothetical protein